MENEGRVGRYPELGRSPRAPGHRRKRAETLIRKNANSRRKTFKRSATIRRPFLGRTRGGGGDGNAGEGIVGTMGKIQIVLYYIYYIEYNILYIC